MTSGKRQSVSGSWLGNYYYDSNSQPYSFEAVFVEVDGVVEGSILDDGQLGEARVSGGFSDPQLKFTKMYGNTALDPVKYQGAISEEGKKLSGDWIISSSAKGRWVAWRMEEEDVPEMNLEEESREENVREMVVLKSRSQK